MILGAFLAQAPTVIQNEASSIWDVCVMIECAFFFDQCHQLQHEGICSDTGL